MLFVHLGLGVLSGCLLTLVLGPSCPLVGLEGPGMVKSVPEDLVVVLEVDVDGLVSIGWSCKDLIPIGILLCLFEGIFPHGCRHAGDLEIGPVDSLCCRHVHACPCCW